MESARTLRLITSFDQLPHNEGYQIYKQCMFHPTQEKYIARIQGFLMKSSCRVYACDQNHRLVGIIILNIMGSIAEIVGIATASKLHGKGIGSYMINQTSQLEGLTTLTAETDDDAVIFYRKNGFQIDKQIHTFGEETVVRYLCQKTLSKERLM